MTTAWITVALAGVTTMALKAAGPLVLKDRPTPPVLARLIGHTGPALLTALVIAAVFGGDHRLLLDPRAAGLAAAILAVALRAPLLVVVFMAAAVTAMVRWLV